MSTAFKLLFALVALICFIQLVELAPENRFRREEPKQEDNTAANFLNGIQEQLREAFKDENLQKFLSSATNYITEGAKAVEGQLKDWQEKVTEKKE